MIWFGPTKSVGFAQNFSIPGANSRHFIVFGDIQTKSACALLGAKQAEVANNHLRFLLLLVGSINNVPSSASTPMSGLQIHSYD
jgi:hypothetical protein